MNTDSLFNSRTKICYKYSSLSKKICTLEIIFIAYHTLGLERGQPSLVRKIG